MATSKHVLFSLHLLLFLFFPIVHSSKNCNTISTCGSDNIPIRFPFHLKNRSPEGCGYPGFGLSCNAENQTTLSIPNSGEFIVRQVIYSVQEILIYDPRNCLPERLLTLDLSASPFSSANYRNYTFLRCPASVTKSRLERIECLSNSTYSVLATSSASVADTMNRSCQVIGTRAVPSWRQVQFEEGFTSSLGGDLRLTWFDPDCTACEIQGGMCGLKSNGSQQIIGCYFSRGGRFNSGLQIFRIICLSIAVPAVTCAFGIACFACYVDRTGPSNARRRGPNAVAAVPDSGPMMMVGLDETTIESYQKLVLGESRRLPGPNDTTCPICLSEYLTKETLRCIPECKHCFHAECIDEWLRLNGTCPICRNTPSASPSPAHVDSTTV